MNDPRFTKDQKVLIQREKGPEPDTVVGVIAYFMPGRLPSRSGRESPEGWYYQTKSYPCIHEDVMAPKND